MYKHILISTDGSEVAQKGVDHGLSLAKSLAARVTVITVTEPFPYYAAASSAGWAPLPIDISGYEEGQKDLADKLLAGVKEAATKLGVEASILYVPNSRPAEAIVDSPNAGLQSDRHVLAWPAWTWPDVAGKPDCGSACP